MRGSLVHAEHRFEFPVLLTRDPDLKTVLLACVAPPLLCYSLNRFVVRPLWRRHRLQKVSLRHRHWQWHANFAHPFCCTDSTEGCGSLMQANRVCRTCTVRVVHCADQAPAKMLLFPFQSSNPVTTVA